MNAPLSQASNVEGVRVWGSADMVKVGWDDALDSGGCLV